MFKVESKTRLLHGLRSKLALETENGVINVISNVI